MSQTCCSPFFCLNRSKEQRTTPKMMEVEGDICYLAAQLPGKLALNVNAAFTNGHAIEQAVMVQRQPGTFLEPVHA